MRDSHRKVVAWLLKDGFDDIQVIAHGRSVNLIYSTYPKNGFSEKAIGVSALTKKDSFKTYGIDIWNIADMICVRRADSKPFLIQVKTNGNLDKVIETTKYGMFQRYKGLRNWIGFIVAKPIKNTKGKVEYRIL